MASSLQIDCIRQSDRHSNRISHVGGPKYKGSRWTWTTEQVIQLIDTEMLSFYVMWRNRQTEVYVVRPIGRTAYLRTRADSTGTNNLLELQRC